MAGKTSTLPFLDRLADRRDEEPGWLAALRGAGIEVYRAEGMPHAKVEAWKYTSLNKLAKIAFEPDAPAPRVRELPAGRMAALDDAYRLVFVNGRFDSDLSEVPAGTAGVTAGCLADRLADPPDWVSGSLGRLLDLDRMPLAALNAADWRDGFVLRLADGARLAKPLHVVSIAGADAPLMFSPRNLVVAGRGSAATIVESHVGLGGAPTFSNVVTEIDAGEGAALDHYKLVDEAEGSFHVAAQALRLAAGARYDGFALTLRGRLVRNECQATLTGAGAECRLNGAYVASGDAHVDNTTLIDHVGAGATSREVFKGVLDDTARGVFQGKILVRRHAQKTDSHQLHKALLLSRGAEVDAKPELEIYANDVKCGHGATTGQLDEAMMFYLGARGIPETEARRLLIEAFLGEVVDEIRSPAVRASFRTAMTRRLAEIGGGS